MKIQARHKQAFFAMTDRGLAAAVEGEVEQRRVRVRRCTQRTNSERAQPSESSCHGKPFRCL